MVESSRLRGDGLEPSYDWSPITYDDSVERDPLTGVAVTEEQELYGDPWSELLATMSPEELFDWFGPSDPPAEDASSPIGQVPRCTVRGRRT